ncbi:hypothetical protein MED222_05655 [Vibrio sp. MED222]|nr:hypothetical protein MED222_05655 [Vibrio sp. MED222]
MNPEEIYMALLNFQQSPLISDGQD